MRVVSLLPSATEIVCALGLRDRLVGVTHECDFPPGIESLPHLTASLIAPDMSSHDIDSAVSTSLRSDEHTLYALDRRLLHELEPDVVLTQSLCEVCAVPTAIVEDAVCSMPAEAQVASLDPMRLNDVFASVEEAGRALGADEAGRRLADELRKEVEGIRAHVAAAPRRSVLAAEWLDPVYSGGHWLPDMIEAAGGGDAFGAIGQPSRRVAWEEIVDKDPDVIVLMPCGFHADEAIARYGEIEQQPEWRGLRAVRDGAVYAVDATSYYSRPGPRLVEGVRILARILHPDLVAGPLPAGSAFRLMGSGSFEPFV